jgi:hypothetical protein
MVKINPEDPSKLEFRKLNDPNDSTLVSIYKHLFRYASPNLFIWGPLAPAHDALFARATMSHIQIAIGLIIFGGTFRRFPSSISTFRRRFTRFSTFLGGSSLIITGIREFLYFNNPNSNPLYVEIQLARELSLLDPSNNGKPNKGSYWFGPKNFMPMNNEQYWKMVYSMEVNEIMSDNYMESPIITKANELLSKNYGPDSIINLKADELTNRLIDIVHKETKNIEVHESLNNTTTLNVFPLFNHDENELSKSKTLKFWTVNNPLDNLQLQEYRDYYSYMYPRIQVPKNEKK